MQRHVLSFLLIFWICASSCFSQLRPAQNHPGEEDRLKRFLQQYLRDSQTPEDNTTRYAVAFVDLKDNGTKDVIVYITGQRWCGSGGCTTLVLAPFGSSYGVNSKIVVTRPPIRVLGACLSNQSSVLLWLGRSPWLAKLALQRNILYFPSGILACGADIPAFRR